MKFFFLGTGSSYPTPNRGVSSFALQFEDGSVWLFDCGEGTQIQLQKVPIHRHKINKIFITHLHGDHLFGLPGLLCTISSQMGCSQEGIPAENQPILDLYGPLGLRKFVNAALSLSRSPLFMKFKVHELQPVEEQYPIDWNDWFVDHNSSCCPLLPSEEPGSIIDCVQDDEGNVHWKLFEDEVHSVEAGFIYHRIPSFGFIIKEKDKVGTLMADKLKLLGVKPGPCYGKLKAGIPITLDDGQKIFPKDVLGPPIKGRTVVICGDTSDASPLAHRVSGCDALVHEATHDDSLLEKAKEFGHSTPSGAAEMSKKLGAKILLLNHFSQRYLDTTEAEEEEKKENTVDILLEQARKCLSGTETEVICAHDLFIYTLQRPKKHDDRSGT